MSAAWASTCPPSRRAAGHFCLIALQLSEETGRRDGTRRAHLRASGNLGRDAASREDAGVAYLPIAGRPLQRKLNTSRWSAASLPSMRSAYAGLALLVPDTICLSAELATRLEIAPFCYHQRLT